MTEVDSETANPSIPGVRIADLITGRIIAAASIFIAPQRASGRALSGGADVYAFSLVFHRPIVDKRSLPLELKTSARKERRKPLRVKMDHEIS
jgi:hypothetical protein